MKKKILFCIFDLKGGGAEKVLANLLKQLNPNKYDITVFAIFGVGVNIERLPQYVNLKYVFKHQFRGFTTLMKFFLQRHYIGYSFEINMT